MTDIKRDIQFRSPDSYRFNDSIKSNPNLLGHFIYSTYLTEVGARAKMVKGIETDIFRTSYENMLVAQYCEVKTMYAAKVVSGRSIEQSKSLEISI